MRKFKKGDTVMIMAGRDRGRQGRILSVLRSNTRYADALRVLVEGLNLIKKHTKPRRIVAYSALKNIQFE